SLARTPGFTLFGVLTLALGIGANTVMFSTFNSIVLKPLPYPDPERLERIDRVTPHDSHGKLAPADFVDLRRQIDDGLGELAAYGFLDVSLADKGQPSQIVEAARATATLFPMLGVKPLLGRTFRSDEEIPSEDRVLVLARRCELSGCGGRPDVRGRTVRVDGEPHAIIGVLPDSFNDWRHLGSIDVFRPLALDAREAADRRGAILRVILRRGAAVSSG